MKRMFKLIGWLVGVSLGVACTMERESANYRVVPLPQEITLKQDKSFELDGNVKIVYPGDNEKMRRNAEFLVEYIQELIGKKLSLAPEYTGENTITLQLGLESSNPEAYRLTVGDNGVIIEGASEAGVFYGIQTLRKSLPIVKNAVVILPGVEINDAPRFGYRGAHLDVSRHFFTIDSVKRFVDMLALHNINRFHWHLTDDQGWRLEIKKYPELVKLGSKRKETVIGRNSGKYDGIPYSGSYTQDEAKEIVAYAAERHITVIPEIDLPGHMQAALTAYPELGCTGGPYDVWRQWGVSEDVLCAGNDKTLKFIEDVLGEIIEIFPSEYIHVGGDECPKVRWAKCPKCQARIKTLGLKGDKKHTAEEKLQSFIISYAEKFLNAHGRQIIGWDEILEGGLAPNATVMSWRGVGGGIEAAKQKHKAIMTPTSYMYFDYYQSKDVQYEPLAIGGYVPLEMVYGFEPVSPSLTPEEANYIIGVQANLWTEYVTSYRHVEYMEMPRIAALSEVQWTQPDKKDYIDFVNRIPCLLNIYEQKGYNFAKHLYNVKAEFTTNSEEGNIEVVLSTVGDAEIYYTLDGTEPTEHSSKYTEALKLKEDTDLRAVAVRPSGKSRVLTEKVAFNKATAKPIIALQPVNKQYEYNGVLTLVDGLQGNANYKTGRWIAFYKNDMEVVIDLLQLTEISSVAINTCVEKGDWVFDARGLMIEVSEDGNVYTKIASESYPVMQEKDKNGIYTHKLTFNPVKTRYVKVKALSESKIPSWHGGKGNPAFLFVDEITID
ncbi:glycoside hydrolase family 20 protein [Odoribacter lunatus]|uniref:glycoside hydrolase family 20 protein n=1 Tax=Odoribacter lunatus TaxID=2941335 RepID=UPI00203BA30B|nr:glycoside hydrolase family 20 protein [Odoribacter lunatus]